MNDPDGNAGAATFTASHDGAGDDASLLSRIGQGDEGAMAAFYREHGAVLGNRHRPAADPGSAARPPAAGGG